MSAHVAVVGSVNADLVLRCRHLPHPGETVKGAGFNRALGGKGANQAVALARCGASVQFIGAVGQDAFGGEVAGLLQAEGIGTEHLHVTGGSTGVAMVMVDERSGENSIALDAGANACLTAAHIDAARDVIATAAFLVCQLESPLEAVRRAIEIAHQASVPVVLNPAPASGPLPSELLGCVDVIVPNALEASVLAGSRSAEPMDVLQAAKLLRRLGARAVVLTRGAQGVLCETSKGTTHFQAMSAPAVVDTTGAGDTFIGAMVAARCRGANLFEAVKWGQAAAAISVSRAGAMASIPRDAEVAEFLARSSMGIACM